jgi:uncharacterized protein (TIGR03435 family)
MFAALSATSGQVTNQPAFDVASIKLVKGVITHSADPSVHGRRVTSIASTLRDLIEYAYEIRGEQIAGDPNGASSDHYDLDARSEGEGTLTISEARQMMQALLAERFQLKVHRETQEVPMYGLVVAKGGPKFHASALDAKGGYMVRGGEKGMHMEAKRTTMDQLARQLSYSAGRPVVDKTGLIGTYAFTLDWYPEGRTPPPDVEAPSIFDALPEQLGLKLEGFKGPMEKLVIDHAERPSEN